MLVGIVARYILLYIIGGIMGASLLMLSNGPTPTMYIWKILGCCGNTKRHCRNAPYCRNIAAIPCNGHCRNVAATLQLRLCCRSIAAIPCCRNIATMGPLLQYAVCIAAIRNASTHCRNIAAMTCCRNIAAMPSGIADYLKSATYPPPCTVPKAEL